MRTLIAITLPLVFGFTNCTSSEKANDSTLDTYDTSDFLYQQAAIICTEWAQDLCYATAAACGEPHTGAPSDCEAVCKEEQFDHCLASIYALPDPSLTVLIMEDACPRGSSANYVSLPDCDTTIEIVDSCNGVVQAGINWESTLRLIDTCPCILTNKVVHSDTYGVDVCAE